MSQSAELKIANSVFGFGHLNDELPKTEMGRRLDAEFEALFSPAEVRLSLSAPVPLGPDDPPPAPRIYHDNEDLPKRRQHAYFGDTADQPGSEREVYP